MRYSPLIPAALGFAASYYCFTFFAPLPVLFLAAPFCAAALAWWIIHRGFARLDMGGGKKFPLPAAVLLGFYAALLPAASVRQSPVLSLPRENIVSLKGIILDDPRAFTRFSGDTAALSMVALEESGALFPGTTDLVRASASGRVQVFFPAGSAPRVKEFGRGGEVYVEGSFTGTSNKAGIFSSTGTFRAVSVHLVRPAPAAEQFRSGLRGALEEKLASRHWGPLALALLVGIRDNLDGPLAESFRNAGVSHILALSGMHLAFLSALLTLLLKKPLGKRSALAAGMVFALVYVTLVGPQPSLVRSVIMYLAGALFVLGGFSVRAAVLLAGAFMLQICLDPASGMTPSFILSYLALAGLLGLSGRLNFLFEGTLPKALKDPLCVSVGAFTASAPAAAAFFAVLRPVGIAAGLGMTPLTALFMVLSIAWLALSWLPPADFVFGRALDLLRDILQWMGSLAGRMPGITAPALPTAAFSVLFAAFVTALEKRRRLTRSYLAPFPS